MNKLYLACMCTVMASTFPVPRVGADGGDFQRDFAEEMRLRGCYPITETGQRWGDLGTGGPVSFSIKYDNDGYSLDYEALNVSTGKVITVCIYDRYGFKLGEGEFGMDGRWGSEVVERSQSEISSDQTYHAVAASQHLSTTLNGGQSTFTSAGYVYHTVSANTPSRYSSYSVWEAQDCRGTISLGAVVKNYRGEIRKPWFYSFRVREPSIVHKAKNWIQWFLD